MRTPTLRKMKRQTFSMVEGRERKKEMSVSCELGGYSERVEGTGSAPSQRREWRDGPWRRKEGRTMFLRSRTSVTAIETTSSSRSLPMI